MPKQDEKSHVCKSEVVAKSNVFGAFDLKGPNSPLDWETIAESWSGGCGICVEILDVLKSTIFLSLNAIENGISGVEVVVIVPEGRFSLDKAGVDALLQNPGKLFAWQLPAGVSAAGGTILFGFFSEKTRYKTKVVLSKLAQKSAVNI